MIINIYRGDTMIQYENNLLYAFSKNEYEYLMDIFNNLFKNSLLFHKKKPKKFRHMKNYFITINSIIYAILYNRPVCKLNLYKTRNSFNHQIEACQNIDDLYETCKNMILFYSKIKNIGIESCSHPVVADTIEYIHNNLDKDLTLEKLANEVHVSKNYLSLLFSKFVGLSLSNYINKLRIEKSKKLIKETNLSLLDIALECGFNSQSYFCSVFKKFEHMSPKRFQHKIKNKELNRHEIKKGSC